MFRRATSIRDKIVNSEFKNELTKIHCKYKGTFMCGTCNFFRFMYTQKNPILPNWKTFYPKHFANCKTIWVIYTLQCGCGCFYVGKTRILEEGIQAYSQYAGVQSWSFLGRHVNSVHGGKFPNVKFLILDQINPSSRGGDWNKTLLQMELQWIHQLKATQPPGQN